MKVVFVYNGAEHYGIEQLSSFLKSKGHEVELVFDPAIFSGDQLINSDLLARLTNIDNKVINNTIKAKPDIVAFSSYTGNYKWCLDIAKKIKDLIDVPVVFGGFHPTAVPDIVM
ncbi:MAG: hypothetical protein GY863_02420, partial [bacterium]|nr:hypothetical protein [bacterium]